MTDDLRVSSLQVRRFLQLPRPSDEVWQGGIVAMPTWIKSAPDAEPQRPFAAVWVSLGSGLIHLEMETDLGQHGLDLGLKAFVQFGLKRYKGLAGRPVRIQVGDPALGELIVRELGDRDLAVDVVSDLHAVKHVIRMFAEDTAEGPLPPGPLSGGGVTVDRMRAFADAAAAFWRAEPWQFLTDEDSIRVEQPVPPPALAHLIVLGNAGISHGVQFDSVPLDADRIAERTAGKRPGTLEPFWAVFFGAIDEMPFGDADLWLDEAFPVAHRDAHPWLVEVGPEGVSARPGRGALTYAEGVLRALAATTEDEVDSGRWTRQVQTADGPTDVTFALPLLLPAERDDPRWRPTGFDPRAMERMFIELERYRCTRPAESAAEMSAVLDEYVKRREAGERPATGETAVERAQDLVFDAFEARGRRRVVLARQALALDPDSADAYVLLAEKAAGPERALPLYQRAVEAGLRRLGPRTLESDMGQFWDLLPTRPYMRALFGLAETLAALARPDEAFGIYRDMLRLNPNDNQGARYRLLKILLDLERDDDAEALTELYPDDALAEWLYARALLAFRREGDTPASRRVLQAAIKANRHVLPLLADEEPPHDERVSHFETGSAAEANACACDWHATWHRLPDAVAWLRRVAAATRTRRAAKAKTRTRAQRRRR